MVSQTPMNNLQNTIFLLVVLDFENNAVHIFLNFQNLITTTEQWVVERAVNFLGHINDLEYQ